jgi:hypothetical protein
VKTQICSFVEVAGVGWVTPVIETRSPCPHHFCEHLARLIHPEMLPDRLRQPALDFQPRIKVVRRMSDRTSSQVERCGAYHQLGHSRIDKSFLPLCLTSQSHVKEARENQDEDGDEDEDKNVRLLT